MLQTTSAPVPTTGAPTPTPAPTTLAPAPTTTPPLTTPPTTPPTEPPKEQIYRFGIAIEDQTMSETFMKMISILFNESLSEIEDFKKFGIEFYSYQNYTASTPVINENFTIWDAFERDNVDHAFFVTTLNNSDSNLDYEEIASKHNFLLWVVDYNIIEPTCGNYMFHMDGPDAFGRQSLEPLFMKFGSKAILIYEKDNQTAVDLHEYAVLLKEQKNLKVLDYELSDVNTAFFTEIAKSEYDGYPIFLFLTAKNIIKFNTDAASNSMDYSKHNIVSMGIALEEELKDNYVDGGYILTHILNSSQPFEIYHNLYSGILTNNFIDYMHGSLYIYIYIILY